MPFINFDTLDAAEIIPGLFSKLAAGSNIMLSLLTMNEGDVVPLHHHPEEQAGIVLKGRMRLTLDDETRALDPGQAYIIPGGTPHAAEAAQAPVLVLDIFSPPREDYAAFIRSGLSGR